MKRDIKWLLSVVLVSFTLFTSINYSSAQIPTKLLDVKNGNGAVVGGFTYPDATIIIYKDAAAKNKIIDAFADVRVYQATVTDPVTGQQIANPQSKQQFYTKALQDILNQHYEASKTRTAEKTAGGAARAAAKAELP